MKAVLVGTGWRSNAYLNISKAIAEILEVTAIFSHSKERAEELRAKGLNAYSSLSEALKNEHDAVLVATRKSFYQDLIDLAIQGEFILAETGFLPLSKEEKDSLKGIKGAVMEQYPYTPRYASLIAGSKRIGKIDQVMLSGIHNHHAISVLREIIDLDKKELMEVESINFPSEIIKTGSRDGLFRGIEKEGYTRKIRLLRFSDSLYIHDFSTNQYHNYLVEKKAEIRGERGVLTFDGLKSVNDEGYPISLPFIIHSDSSKTSGPNSISHISLGSEIVYKNPFYPAVLSEDEIGIAQIIKNIEEGKGYKDIEGGIADATLGEIL